MRNVVDLCNQPLVAKHVERQMKLNWLYSAS